jgi:hypothetical protein
MQPTRDLALHWFEHLGKGSSTSPPTARFSVSPPAALIWKGAPASAHEYQEVEIRGFRLFATMSSRHSDGDCFDLRQLT